MKKNIVIFLIVISYAFANNLHANTDTNWNTYPINGKAMVAGQSYNVHMIKAWKNTYVKCFFASGVELFAHVPENNSYYILEGVWQLGYRTRYWRFKAFASFDDICDACDASRKYNNHPHSRLLGAFVHADGMYYPIISREGLLFPDL